MYNETNNEKLILGVTAFSHNASFSLVRGDELLFSSQLERYTRIKNDSGCIDKDINNTCSPEDERLIASKENFEKIYALYPKKTGKAKALEYYMQWHKGRKLSGFDKAIKLTNKQMYLATMKYVAEKKDSETDLQYYKGFDVFMNKAILDYVDMDGEQT